MQITLHVHETARAPETARKPVVILNISSLTHSLKMSVPFCVYYYYVHLPVHVMLLAFLFVGKTFVISANT